MSVRQSVCPNPNGVTVEFGEDVIEARAWRIKGVGMYGSDVDVIAVDEYRDLAHLQRTTMETLTRWADSAAKAKERVAALARAGEELAEAVRGLDSYAASSQVAPLERSERASAALADWDAVMGDELIHAIEGDN